MRAITLLITLAGIGLFACNTLVGIDNAYVLDGTSSASVTATSGSNGSGADGSGGEDGGSGVGGLDGSGGSGGAPILNCDLSGPEGVGDGCGVFVSSIVGDDSNEGTKAKPVKTFAKAIAEAQTRSLPNVYACAEEFTEAVVVDAKGITIYGGLDCMSEGWPYIGLISKTTLKADFDQIPLTLGPGAEDVRVSDFLIQAADATLPGGSSITVLANGASGELLRCSLSSGAGASGMNGAAGGPDGAPELVGVAGLKGEDQCDGNAPADVSLGGAFVQKVCADADASTSTGGKGGNGNTLSNGGNGQNGSSTPENGLMGKGGMGAAALCSNGQAGSPGASGMAGAGATGVGMLSSAGYVGTSGGTGTAGKVGQGGGGGGGLKGGAACNGPGAAGGGGGAGGCGGLPATGGGSGGSSIALVIYRATITLTDCLLTADNGGAGGKGGQGQAGGAGGAAGPGGSGSPMGCSGGKGGNGGGGGSGGGGLGGHSLGVAHIGAIPPKQINPYFKTGTAGKGGLGGAAAMDGTAGEDGADGIGSALLSIPEQI